MRRLVFLMLAFCPATVVSAADVTTPRYVEFRDGTILHVPLVDDTWKVAVLKTEGKLGEASVRLADLEGVSFTAERSFEKKKAMLAEILKLGAEDFDDREKAQAELLKMGNAIRPDIMLLKDKFSDPEIKVRLEKLLSDLPAEDRTAIAFPFDVFRGKESLWGDAGEAAISIQVEGKVIRLTRKEIVGFSLQRTQHSYGSAGGAFKQLEDKDFPAGCIEEGFATTPEGRPLKIGENVEKLFIAKGFTLSTSIKTSFVSVNNYEVQGKSKGLSCATHEPLWHGEVTITFCKPGDESTPAGVHWFGTWIAYVEVNGTAVHAYDFQGNEIGKVAVRKQAHDFLAFYSPVPIHKVRVVPNLQIDPDYTLDDFIFDPPRPPEPPHPDRCLAEFLNGETLLCRDVSFGPDGVVAKGLTAGLPDRIYHYEDVVRMVPPERKDAKGKSPTGVFVELDDGSILFGAKPSDEKAGPNFARRPDVLNQSDKIVALWGAAHARPMPVAKKPPVVAKLEEGKETQWLKVRDVKFNADQIRYELFLSEVSATVESPGYFDAPPMLLKERPGKPAHGWYLRTVQGDELFLTGEAKPGVSGTLQSEFKVNWDGKELKVAPADIVALTYKPPSQK